MASQYQEEIPEVRPIVRRFDIEVGRCSQCRRRVQGRHALQTSDALGAAGAQLGPGVVALVQSGRCTRDDAAAIFRWRRSPMVLDGTDVPAYSWCITGDNKPVEHMTLQTDLALRYEDDDLETCDIRPIATPAALEEDGLALRRFLARACTHIAPATRAVKASALARASRSRTWGETENEPRPFAIEEIAAWGTPLGQDHSERCEIYDATAGPEGITIAEPGWCICGYLQTGSCRA